MTEFNETAVVELRTKIEATFREFMLDSSKPKVKAAVRRSRKRTSELEKMFKEYRKISIK